MNRLILFTAIPLFFTPSNAMSQFTGQWLDIGSYHHIYSESGGRNDPPSGMEYPAILRRSGHIFQKAFWIGVKNWTDESGQHYPYYVLRIGLRESAEEVTFPVQNTLIGRYEDTTVEVDGIHSVERFEQNNRVFEKEAVLEMIDPDLPADRMIHNIHNTSLGITVDRKIYAYTHAFHDNYHIIDYTYCNTGNTDGDSGPDAEIELPQQTLHEVYFFRIHWWRGN